MHPMQYIARGRAQCSQSAAGHINAHIASSPNNVFDKATHFCGCSVRVIVQDFYLHIKLLLEHSRGAG